jgi:hypothetical protein
MNQSNNYKASCFCGAVRLRLNGAPEAMAYCHCDSCRRWSAGPVNAFTLWNPDAVQITGGSDNVASYDKNPLTGNENIVSKRQWCKTCGGHIFTEHPTMGLVDVPAVVIENFVFEPGFHVHYQETVHQVSDGLPKFRDLPREAGGSGEQLPE